MGMEGHTDSEEWLDLVDRGELTRVNETAFQVFLATELELRNSLHSQHIPNFKAKVRKEILENEDIAFYWSILSCDWEVDASQALLELLVDLFLTIRGFSYASAWMEKYKAATAKTLQKVKGVRKNSRCHKNFKHFHNWLKLLFYVRDCYVCTCRYYIKQE